MSGRITGLESRTIGTATALAIAALATLVLGLASATGLMAAPLETALARTAPHSFADVIERVRPAVVSVKVVRERGKREAAGARRELPEAFRRFFDRNMPRHPGQRRMPPGSGAPESAALGSGFIVDAEGHIVTNEHVIRGGGRITVTMHDGKSHDARLVGADAKTDLALLKIDAKVKLPFVGFGDSDKARVGDWVVTVGSPFGLGHTATAGIISARGREIGAGPYDDFLQIDAAINRGNSGGPAFDASGKVIGVNTAIFSPNGGSVGIGFAIPARIAKDVIAQLKEKGSVERGWLGVNIQRVTPDLAQGLKLDRPKGALVAQVTTESPAARAGLRQGDVILSVNGKDIRRFRDVARMIARVKPGATARLGIWRDGRKSTITATIDSLPDADKLARIEPGKLLGMRLAALDGEIRRAYRIEPHEHGVIVSDVEPESAAWRKGLRRGDLIVMIDRDRVVSPADVAERIEQARRGDGKAVLLLISRNTQQSFVALPLRDA